MNLKKKIITLAKSLGIEILRIADPLILKNTLDHKLSLLKDNKIPESEKWFIENIIRSVNPALHLQVVKSVIVCALPVNNADKNIKYPFAKIAPFARCDYYCHLKEKLKKIAEQIKKNFRPDLLYKVFSNGPLSEKPFAQISGLGFYGKNSIIYTKKYGSFIVLGLMLTNMDLKPDKPLNSDCGECEICIRSCPVNAIEKPYVVNHSKCIQYIMEKDVEPDMNILEHFRNSFYGCAICQDVCPRNKSIKVRKKYPDIGKCGSKLDIIKFLKINKSEFNILYKPNQMTKNWISFNALRRNALIVLGNYKDKRALKHLEELKKENNPYLEKYINRAIKNINKK